MQFMNKVLLRAAHRQQKMHPDRLTTARWWLHLDYPAYERYCGWCRSMNLPLAAIEDWAKVREGIGEAGGVE